MLTTRLSTLKKVVEMEKHTTASRHHLLAEFCEFLSKSMGLYFHRDEIQEFERKLSPIPEAFGFPNLEECLEWLMKEPLNEKKITILARYLTVGETYFFRDTSLFKALEEKILPELLHSRAGKNQHLKIWCAACCSGEEPYSIAILLNRLIPNLQEWNIEILGTDINSQFLAKARKGIYKEWSFRSMSTEFKNFYFTKSAEGRYTLAPEIRKLVTFRYLNLAGDAYPSETTGTENVDIILCNNVLIYFSPDTINGIVKKLTASLNKSGLLIVSPIEVPYVEEPHLHAIKIYDSTLFVKGNKKPHFAETFVASQAVTEKTQDYSTIQVELPAFLNLEHPLLEFNFQAPPTGAAVPAKKPITQPEKGPGIIVHSNENDVQTSQTTSQDPSNELKDIMIQTRLHANKGELELANKCCMKALSMEKLDSGLHFLHASILLELDRVPEALEACKRSLYLDSDFVIAQFTMGNLLLKMNRVKEARRHFDNAYQLLKKYKDDDTLPATEGMMAKSMRELITIIQDRIV